MATMELNELGRLYRLAYSHESAKVRAAALQILTMGRTTLEDTIANATPDNVELWEALRGAGCVFEYGRGPRGTYDATCKGARRCYGAASFFRSR